MRNFFLFCLALALSLPIRAEDFYVAQNAAGAANGTNEANAYAVTFFNTGGNWGVGAGKISAADTVHLCGTISTSLVVGGSGSNGSPVTIVFESGAKLSKAAWGVDTAAAIYANNKDYLVIDGGTNGIIECTNNGDLLGVQQPVTGIRTENGSDDWEIKNLTIRNLYVHTNGQATVSGMGGYVTLGIKMANANRANIHNNVMNHAYTLVYIYTETGVALTGHLIKDNVMSAASTAVIVSCGSGSSRIDNTTIDGNDITMGYNWYDTPGDNHIDGIHLWSGSGIALDGVIIRNNYIHGQVAHSTGFIYLENTVTTAYVYNNLLVGSVAAPSEGYINTNYTGTCDIYLFNNTIVGVSSTNGNAIAFDPARVGSTYHIRNNIFKDCSMGFYTGQQAGTWDSDYNMWYNTSYFGWWGATHPTTIGAWQSVTGGDAHYFTTNPGFDGSYRFTSASPAYQAGADLSATFTTYRDGSSRPAGAFNLGSEPLQGGGGDTTPPTPNPSTIASTSVLGTTSYSVTATTATDAGSPPVEYRFSKDGGSTWTAYQSSATYTFTGLTAATLYPTQVQARDSAGTPNVTTASSSTNVTTDAAVTIVPKGAGANGSRSRGYGSRR